MDRHIEFTSQLSRLVALYSRDPVDHAAEKVALRAVRGAAKHGAVELSIAEGQLRTGHNDASTEAPDVAALRLLLTALGVVRIKVPHHAKQEEVKRLAKLLGRVTAGQMTPQAFADDVATHAWKELTIERLSAVSEVSAKEPTELATETSAETVAEATAEVSAQPSAEMAAEPTAEAGAQAETPATDVERFAEEDTAATSAREAAEAPPEGMPAPAEEPDVVPSESTAAEAVVTPEEEPPPAEPAKPLAEKLPPEVERLAGPDYREFFNRLITSSEPGTLRRLLEPVQSAIEQTAREGAVLQSARMLLAMFAVEALAEEEEMRRQFLVVQRRLTKPTLIRAYAMSYLESPEAAADIAQVLARFDEDGAEAVADCIGTAPDRTTRDAYLSLLGRMPGTNDALLAMLDDDRVIVVERAIELMVTLQHPDLERVLGEQLGHDNVRVRVAAARALASATGSSFAADALLRATQDAAPEVRLTAAVGLQSRREERLSATVVPRLDEEDELDVQIALVGVLGRLATADAVQKLIALANPTERMLRRRRAPVLRLVAIEALGEARTPAAMVALQKLLEDKEKEVREAAARLYTRARRQTAAMGVAAVSDS